MYPRIGVGLYVIKDGMVLMGKRKGNFAPGMWCAPGGKLEYGEEPAVAAEREALEEASVVVKDIRFIGYTNDITDDGQHWVTFGFAADWESGDPRVCEPDKCEEWRWVVWDGLPEPQFASLRNFVKKGYNPVTSSIHI